MGAAPRPNLVFLCVDQMRYDALGCTGNRVARTPHLDRLAAGGMVLHQHHTPSQICSPSRATMATGLYPRTHGLTRNGIALPEHWPTLWSLLRAQGMRTHAVGKLHYQPLLAGPEHRMPESLVFWESPQAHHWHGPFYGFDTVDLVLGEANESTRAGHYAHWLHTRHPGAALLYEPEAALAPRPGDLKEVWKNAVPPELHYTHWIGQRAAEALRNHAGAGGLCLFVSFPDPHHPFTPPAPYCDQFDPGAVPAPTVVPGELDRMPPYLQHSDDPTQDAYIHAGQPVREQGFMVRTDRLTPATVQSAIAHTYGSVSMIDGAVGHILDALDASGSAERTHIVFTSDHGELLGDHGLLRKGPPPYRQLLQVPMLWSGPGVARGASSHALTSHLDFVPTFAGLFGLQAPENDGRDLSALLACGQDRVRDAVCAEYHPRADRRLYNQTLITEDWRCTIYPHEPGWGELFDRREDPWEHRNLFGEPVYQPVFERMRARLREEMPPAPDAGAPVLGAY